MSGGNPILNLSVTASSIFCERNILDRVSSDASVNVAYRLTRLRKMLILLVTTLLATTPMCSQNKEDPAPLEQIILTGVADNSTGEEDTASEELLVNLQEQEWVGDAVKDIAYYLRAHKFNDFDRRWFTRADDAATVRTPPLLHHDDESRYHWLKRLCGQSFPSV
uniref:Uncharacterized protein n=1 Tax=Timema poppense TaxID=170557 RepID=A0A7R9DH50_TIMPO|nr:unnamed protein product [Timema poppensis]